MSVADLASLVKWIQGSVDERRNRFVVSCHIRTASISICVIDMDSGDEFTPLLVNERSASCISRNSETIVERIKYWIDHPEEREV